MKPGNTALFEEILQQGRSIANTLFDLIGPRFELQTSHSREERVIVRPSGWSIPTYPLIIIYSLMFNLYPFPNIHYLMSICYSSSFISRFSERIAVIASRD